MRTMSMNKSDKQEREETPLPPLFLRCTGCPYKSHGFICWSGDGSCMRTWLNDVRKKKGEIGDEKSDCVTAE
jgi:hypothetical protein